MSISSFKCFEWVFLRQWRSLGSLRSRCPSAVSLDLLVSSQFHSNDASWPHPSSEGGVVGGRLSRVVDRGHCRARRPPTVS